MQIAILGFGKIGKMHARALENAGHDLVLIDPASAQETQWPLYSGVENVSPALIARIDLWIIASPTHCHLPNAKAILNAQPNANVLIEKPAVLPGEIAQLLRLQEQHPEARLAVQDTYWYSPVTDLMLTSLKSIGAPLKSLAIEMSKNRRHDELQGRFLDSHWGPAGYEGFHLLSLAERLRGTFSSEDCEPRLITSCDGVVTLQPQLLYSAFSSAARQLIARRHIPFANEFRFRLIQGEFANGEKFELAFEPQFEIAGFKNRHALAWTDRGTTHVRWYSGNHFSQALYVQVALLRLRMADNFLSAVARHKQLVHVELPSHQSLPTGIL